MLRLANVPVTSRPLPLSALESGCEVAAFCLAASSSLLFRYAAQWASLLGSFAPPGQEHSWVVCPVPPQMKHRVPSAGRPSCRNLQVMPLVQHPAFQSRQSSAHPLVVLLYRVVPCCTFPVPMEPPLGLGVEVPFPLGLDAPLPPGPVVGLPVPLPAAFAAAARCFA